MNDVMNKCFVGAKILRFVWWWFGSVRERESCSEGDGFGFRCFQIGSVREKW